MFLRGSSSRSRFHSAKIIAVAFIALKPTISERIESHIKRNSQFLANLRGGLKRGLHRLISEGYGATVELRTRRIRNGSGQLLSNLLSNKRVQIYRGAELDDGGTRFLSFQDITCG